MRGVARNDFIGEGEVRFVETEGDLGWKDGLGCAFFELGQGSRGLRRGCCALIVGATVIRSRDVSIHTIWNNLTISITMTDEREMQDRGKEGFEDLETYDC